ncbi:MAG: lipid-A-disaccharide synthase-related protein, partial [Synergistetes bacterium]|nr:lipid-A-disaccharide synthase-related protein [Synergistota bacterium]
EDVVTRAVLKELDNRHRMFVLPIVGSGKIFEEIGVYNVGPVSLLPSGGIIKYQWTALLRDLMAGLLGIIWRQVLALRVIKHRVSRVVCVGDVYIFLLAVLFLKKRPVLVGVAKSVFIRGYFWIERLVLRRWAEAVFCRDEPTKEMLQSCGVNAIYVGNPIMDGFEIKGRDFGIDKSCCSVVGILPGSRSFVYKDIGLILDAVEYIADISPLPVRFIMALSKTVDADVLERVASRKGWHMLGGVLKRGKIEIIVEREAFGDVIAISDVIMGLAGTGNQQAAGLGKPIVSVRDRGKLVQKMLLGDSEVLVDYSYVDMAEEVLSILMDEGKRRTMGKEGVRRMGPRGAVSRIVEWLEGGQVYEGNGGYSSEVSLNKISGKGSG